MLTPEQYAKAGTEHAEQVALFMWASVAQKIESRLKWLFAIPNGGLRDKRTAGRLKAEGVKRGVSDIFLPVVIYDASGLFIELKRIGADNRKSGIESGKQLEFRDDMLSAGYAAYVCYGWQHACEVICNYLDVSKIKLDEYVAAEYAKTLR